MTTDALFALPVVRAAFREAATLFVETVARVPDNAWETPGLGAWTLRALVGHTSRSLVTVETYLDAGATEIIITSPADYYLQALAPDDALVGMPIGGMTLLAYLPTRIVELTIHTLDLSVALGEDVNRPLLDIPAAITAQVITDLAHRRGLDSTLFLAARGRRPLSAGFTIL